MGGKGAEMYTAREFLPPTVSQASRAKMATATLARSHSGHDHYRPVSNSLLRNGRRLPYLVELINFHEVHDDPMTPDHLRNSMLHRIVRQGHGIESPEMNDAVTSMTM